MKKLFFGFLLFIVAIASAQTPAKPKLVVGIVVDQMRWDFLYRFYNRYETGGFKRLLGQGFSCENTFIPYTPAHTAAGHACVYTGSVPALNGIIGNTWYSKELGRSVYCTEDSTVKTVGSNSDEGEMSPLNLWASTVSDELRIATNFKSKTIGIALKDRGSILPAGHTANAAYWFDNASGGWITSTYYMQAMPNWMVQFNNRRLPDEYMKKSWNTLYPINTYTQSTADDKSYEHSFPTGTNSFPHQAEKVSANKYEIFRATPYGNTYTLETAKAAIEGENLGGRGVTDFLAVSFSSTDYIGHAYGPNSVEIEDTYLRLDKDFSALLSYLDTKLGKDQYLVFLTADHAVAHNTGFAKEARLIKPSPNAPSLQRSVNEAVKNAFGDGKYILAFSNYQVHLNNELIAANKIDREALKQTIIRALIKQPEIFSAVDLEKVQSANLPDMVRQSLINGYNQKLSGEVQYLYKPQYGGYEKGAAHGYWNPYDSHIPLVWFGWKIKSGKMNREVYMTDIAPTVAALLQIQMPNASVGKVIEEVIAK